MTYTVNQMMMAIGKETMVRMEGLSIRCRIVDAKQAYGKVRLLVEPAAGMGCQWIEMSRISVLYESAPVNINERISA